MENIAVARASDESPAYLARAHAAWMRFVCTNSGDSAKEAFIASVLEAMNAVRTATSSPTCIAEPVRPPDTIKVRICVAVDTDGHWSAHGERGDNDSEMMTHSSDYVSDPYALTFVEAYVPLPRALSTVAAHSVQPVMSAI